MLTLEEVRRRIEEALGVSQVDWWLDEAVRMILAHRATVARQRVYDVSSLGARIRTAREIVGLTQHQLAARLGKNRREKHTIGWDVSSWERGKQDLPAEHFPGLCAILGVSRAWLLGETDEGGPPMPSGILRRQKLVNWREATMKEQKKARARAELERLRGLREPKKTQAGERAGKEQVLSGQIPPGSS